MTATTTQPGVALRVRGLCKRFGAREALRDVGFEIAPGALVAVIGPNGAGKTTLLSILAGVQTPSGGEIDHGGGTIGWVPQDAALYGKLTVAENLRLFAQLEGIDDLDATVAEMLALTGLEDRGHDQAGTLSGGNRQRVNIAIGMLARPSVLLLDEPSSSLDPRQRARLWEFVGALGRAGTSVVYTTHNVQEAERYADRLLVLADGELLWTGTPRELEREVGASDLDFEGAFVAFLRARGH